MNEKWWHKSVVYQIYPKSFHDSNGDGIGDIQGIIMKLDYLKALGIDVIWLSPVYKSPMDDNGYDISDYYDIDPSFGTMEDMEELIAKAKEQGIKIVMDLVVNHTSDEHPWFIESRSSKDNPKRDWYIWRKPKEDGSEPNNWGSHFTRKAWCYDETTGEYYLHLFSKKQPDLNWANPEVRAAVYEMMHFWLKKGIGGFRMDVINMIGKPQDYPDAAFINDTVVGNEHWANNSLCHQYLREMNEKVLSHYDILTVGETPFVTAYEGKRYSHPDRKELGMIFQFEHMFVDRVAVGDTKKPIDLVKLKSIMAAWQDELHNNGWNSLYWNNHDQARVVSRFGSDDVYRVESAKMLGTLLHLMSGTPYIYQGEEFGTTNTHFDTIEEYNDLADHHKYDVMVNDKGLSSKEALNRIRPFSRDNARVPVAWNDEKNGGFTEGTPWIGINPKYKQINAEKALKESDSIFHYYKELIHLRKNSKYSPVIVYGTHQLLLAEDNEVYAYIRELNGTKLLVIANFFRNEVVRSFDYKIKELILSNYSDVTEDLREIKLRPYEAVVFEVE